MTSKDNFLKEKAKQLVDKFYLISELDGSCKMTKHASKQCALIAVDEVLSEYKDNSTFTQPVSSRVFMYQRIRQEIEKL